MKVLSHFCAGTDVKWRLISWERGYILGTRLYPGNEATGLGIINPGNEANILGMRLMALE